jgi:hypothetical protein
MRTPANTGFDLSRTSKDWLTFAAFIKGGVCKEGGNCAATRDDSCICRFGHFYNGVNDNQAGVDCTAVLETLPRPT